MNSSVKEIDMAQFLTAQSPETLAKLGEMIRQFQDTGEAVTLSRVIKNTKKRGKIKNIARTISAKRPLNSFIAFRTYYALYFASCQQKDISGFINQLWIADLFKSKWTIVAAAYSVIRDRVGKANAPLHAFLALVCPKVGILPPSTYFQQMGWVYSITERELKRQFIPNNSNFNSTTNESVASLFAFANEQGYGIGATSSTDTTCSPTIIMAVNPTNLNQVNNNTVLTANPLSLNDESHVDTQQAGFQHAHENDETIEPSQASEFVSDISMNIHANNALLSASGDSYPFSAQFTSDDITTETGLYMDMSYHINDQDTPGFFDEFIRF